MIDNFTTYSQTDVKWGNDILGFNTSNKYNLYNYGCLVTCLAMVLTYYTNDDILPNEVNTELKKIKGFVQGGLYVWGSLGKKYSYLDEVITWTPNPLNPTDCQNIYDNIDKGSPVILQVDINPSTGINETHYVVAIGYKKDKKDFFIADPIDGKKRWLSEKYFGEYVKGAKYSVYQYILYNYSKPPESPQKITQSDFIIQLQTDNAYWKRRALELDDQLKAQGFFSKFFS